MNLKNAPISKASTLSPEQLTDVLAPLVGSKFKLTMKPRTDGSAIRKLVSALVEQNATNADKSKYDIIPPKGKGVPKLLAELIDTYVITSGDTYNLQVWNRNPSGKSPLIKYSNGEVITPSDIRLVMVKIDMNSDTIESIIVLTPDYIERKFGKFGKPTIKNQLLVGGKERQSITASLDRVLFYEDTEKVKRITTDTLCVQHCLSTDKPTAGSLLSLNVIKEEVAEKLIGRSLASSDTKTRGQLLERMVIDMLGYNTESKLVGGYPDVPNQLLEVKVQDTQTVDLGKYSPQFEELINDQLSLTTYDVRYLIALTNPSTNIIEGVILSRGESLGEKFTYVSDTSYKCQRSIPMEFFENFKGQCVFNP